MAVGSDLGSMGGGRLQVELARGERPLYVLLLVAAIGVWALLAISMLGAIYAALLGVFFFVAHLAFITTLRGNAVRLGEDQMPELYARVEALSQRIGMKEVPEAYVIQAGGSLNALATRFLRSNVIVLFSDLLEACGDNEDARDFIVAHELGHLHAGHLRWRWFLLPGMLVPFLGGAWSRACEYTCDRYGFAAAGNPDRALDGLCILAAGGVHGPRVNRAALVAQRNDLNTVLMRLGVWLSTHPPIANRLVALDPALGPKVSTRRSNLVAATLLLLLFGIPTVVAVGAAWKFLPDIQAAFAQQGAAGVADPYESSAALAEAERGIMSLVEAVEAYRGQYGSLPPDGAQVYLFWETQNPGMEAPTDPWSFERYGYAQDGERYEIRSVGPDGFASEDDLYYASPAP